MSAILSRPQCVEDPSVVTVYPLWIPPVSGEVPAQMPVTQSFDVFFDLHMNERLSKYLWGWWLDAFAPIMTSE